MVTRPTVGHPYRIRHRARMRYGCWPRPARDGGFTLVEVMVAITLIGLVMAAVLTFFGRSVAVTNQQGGRQAAVQLASGVLEQARAVPSATLTTATLPAVTIDGVAYQLRREVTPCWQAVAGAECLANPAAGEIALLRLAVEVTWPDRACAGGTCSYRTATLLSVAAAEPRFHTNQSALQLVAEQLDDKVTGTGVPVSLQLLATGGVSPYTWAGTGLPPGITVSSGGQVTGAPTGPGTHAVTLIVTDATGNAATAAFTWTVGNPPQLVEPADQTTPAGTEVSLQVAHNGGAGTLTWTASGLPTGLTIDGDTGEISGTPTTATAAAGVAVTVRVTDGAGATDSVDFLWTVPVAPAETEDQTSPVGAPVSLAMTAVGATGPVTWTATGLPPGLAINPTTGVIDGTPTGAGVFDVEVAVTDGGAVEFTWTVQ